MRPPSWRFAGLPARHFPSRYSSSALAEPLLARDVQRSPVVAVSALALGGQRHETLRRIDAVGLSIEDVDPRLRREGRSGGLPYPYGSLGCRRPLCHHSAGSFRGGNRPLLVYLFRRSDPRYHRRNRRLQQSELLASFDQPDPRRFKRPLASAGIPAIAARTKRTDDRFAHAASRLASSKRTAS